jgi:hypothetical protein
MQICLLKNNQIRLLFLSLEDGKIPSHDQIVTSPLTNEQNWDLDRPIPQPNDRHLADPHPFSMYTTFNSWFGKPIIGF